MVRSPAAVRPASIIFFDQGNGALLRELVEAAAAELGSVVYYSPGAAVLVARGVRSVSTPSHHSVGTMNRLLGWAGFLFVMGTRGLTESGRPLLFIVSNPPLSPMLGLIAKKLKHQPYVLLFYDMWPEALVRFGGMSERAIVVRLWRRLNRAAVRHADRVITISPDLAHTLAQYGPREVHVIPTWVDTDRIRPQPKDQNPFARQHGLLDKFTVLYSGNMGAVHDLTMLPDIADRLCDQPAIQFVIIGDGLGRRRLQAECEQRGLSNVLFLPFQDEAVVPYSLAAAEVGVVALAADGEGVSMPSKTYYTMAAGSALLGLCRHGSDLDRVITAHDCGITVPPREIDRAVQALLDWYRHPEQLQVQRSNARQAAERLYSRAVCVPRMLQIVSEAIK
jgi:glycosyltransferase involved in cell wall biosynthesis